MAEGAKKEGRYCIKTLRKITFLVLEFQQYIVIKHEDGRRVGRGENFLIILFNLKYHLNLKNNKSKSHTGTFKVYS